MFYANQLMMFQILLKLKFCAIHLSQDLTVLILLSLTLQLLKSNIGQYHRKLRDDFSWSFYQYFRWRLSRFRMLCCSSCSVPSVNGKIPFGMLFIINFKAPFTFHLLIKILNFIEILAIFMLLSRDFSLACIVCPLLSSAVISSSSHNFSLLSRAA